MTNKPTMTNTPSDGIDWVLYLLLMLLLLAVCAGVHWYRSSVQAGVYEREGIEITTYEVFFGAKPAERSIKMKE